MLSVCSEHGRSRDHKTNERQHTLIHQETFAQIDQMPDCDSAPRGDSGPIWHSSSAWFDVARGAAKLGIQLAWRDAGLPLFCRQRSSSDQVRTADQLADAVNAHADSIINGYAHRDAVPSAALLAAGNGLSSVHGGSCYPATPAENRRQVCGRHRSYLDRVPSGANFRLQRYALLELHRVVGRRLWYIPCYQPGDDF